jgi:predicted DNA-binding transcriptional regulator YafY
MQRVIERVLNLLAFLLTAGRPVTAGEIRHTVAGYDQEGDEAFRRTFERDKDLLRHLGVPLRLQHTDAWEVEQGYVVPRDEYALPDPGLSDEERAALRLAAQVVRLEGAAPDSAALLKLGGAPADGAGEPLAADLGIAAGHLPALFDAVAERKRIAFRYRETVRRVRPYGLVHRRGHWYAVGEQDAPADGGIRAFRVDRISALEVDEPPGAFRRPTGFRAADALPEAPWEAGEDEVTVEVRFDAPVAWWARRQLTARSEVRELSDGGLEARFGVANIPAFIGWLIGFGDAAEILGPDAVRQRMIDHLGTA